MVLNANNGVKHLFPVTDLQCVLGFSAATLASSHSPATCSFKITAQVNWWFSTGHKCDSVHERLRAPCDRLATCPGCTTSLTQWQLGQTPTPSAAPPSGSTCGRLSLQRRTGSSPDKPHQLTNVVGVKTSVHHCLINVSSTPLILVIFFFSFFRIAVVFALSLGGLLARKTTVFFFFFSLFYFPWWGWKRVSEFYDRSVETLHIVKSQWKQREHYSLPLSSHWKKQTRAA